MTGVSQQRPISPDPPSNQGADELTLRDREIVFLSHQRWDTHLTAVQHMVRQLLSNNRVLFIEPPESVLWLLHEPPARQALRWWFQPLEERRPNFSIYHTPPLFPPWRGRFRPVAAAVNSLYEWHIRRAMRGARCEQSIFWIFQFGSAEVVRSFKPMLSVYECAEEWAAYSTRPRLARYLREKDADLCRTADVVFVPSEALLEQRKMYNRHTYLIPWGVDTQLYAAARLPETPIPPELERLPKPILGMFGMLDGRRLHIELLTFLASQHPEWTIVLIGRRMPNLDESPLRVFPNVRILDFKPADQLPGYCKAFQVCLIPYMINEFTRSIMPLKLVEYLATGRPVVTTALPAAKPFENFVYVAHDLASFERQVIRALHEDPLLAEQRVAKAREYDWNLLAARKLALAAMQLANRR